MLNHELTRIDTNEKEQTTTDDADDTDRRRTVGVRRGERRTTSVKSVNRADGISEIEGKAATGSGERVGKGASFKSVVEITGVRRGGRPTRFVLIGVHSWLNLISERDSCRRDR